MLVFAKCNPGVSPLTRGLVFFDCGAVIRIVMRLLPAGDGRGQRRAMTRPHFIDERFPALSLARPVFIVVLAGGLFDYFHEAGVVLVHPAIHVVEKGFVVPGFLRVEQSQRKGLSNPANAGAAAAIALAR